jgi:Ni,Fe-hydrogenase I small subunit
MTPEKMIARLQRTVDELRWFKLLEANGGDILNVDGNVTVTMKKDGHYLYGRAETLRGALAEIDADLAARQAEARRSRAFDRLMGRTKGD